MSWLAFVSFYCLFEDSGILVIIAMLPLLIEFTQYSKDVEQHGAYLSSLILFRFNALVNGYNPFSSSRGFFRHKMPSFGTSVEWRRTSSSRSERERGEHEWILNDKQPLIGRRIHARYDMKTKMDPFQCTFVINHDWFSIGYAIFSVNIWKASPKKIDVHW